MEVDDLQARLIYQSLRWMDVNISRSEESFPAENQVYIIIETETATYQYPYVFSLNLIGIPDHHHNTIGYYADINIYQIVASLLDADPLVGDIFRLQHEAHLEQIDGKQIRNDGEGEYQALLLNNLSQEQWDKELEKLTPISHTDYYDSCPQQVLDIDLYAEGILKLGSSLVFLTEEYRTTGDVKIGDTTAMVLEKWGEPQSKTTSKWSYAAGDYLRFHLLIDQDTVKYLLLSRPC